MKTAAGDLIVLSLRKVRKVAELWCAFHCRRQYDSHTDLCLLADVEAHDQEEEHVTDDRIVLPLTATREHVATLHAYFCGGPIDAPAPDHDARCWGLLRYLVERDALAAADAPVGQVSEDCRDPFKHDSCTGCLCDCHRPLGGLTSGPSSPRPRHTTPT